MNAATQATGGGGRLGAGERCPVCAATGGVVPDDDGYACIVCGAPRVLVTEPIPRPGSEKPLLEEAKRLRLRRAAWGVGAGVATALGVVIGGASGVAAALTDLGAMGSTLAVAGALTPLLFGLFGFWKVSRTTARASVVLEEAQLKVTEELMRARGGALDAGELARLLRVAPGAAEALLARAQVERLLDPAEPGPRLRVDEGVDAPVVEDEAEARRDRVR